MFKRNRLYRLFRSSLVKSDISVYIAPGSEEKFKNAFLAYNNAKRSFEERNNPEAKKQIQTAFDYLREVDGESPALAACFIKFNKLRNDIQNNDSKEMPHTKIRP